MITTPIFTRLLSTSEYGQYNVFNSWYGILTILISLNLFTGVHQQGLIKFDKQRPQFTSSLLGLTTFLVGFWTIIYLLFKDFWNEVFSLSTVQMLAMLIMILTSAAFNFWVNEQRVYFKYRAIVVITLIVSLLKPVLGIILVLNSEDKVTARILAMVIVELFAYTGLYFIQLRRGKIIISAEYWKYALIFNLPLVPHFLSQTILNNADRIMIQNLVGESEAGIYSVAYAVSSLTMLFNMAIAQTLNPWFYQKIKDKRTKEIAPVGYTTLVIIASVNIVLIILGPEAISIFAPASYYDAIWVIPPVAMGTVFLYSYELFSKFAFYYEKTVFTMIISVAGAALNILLNYIFINLFGYLAAGYTTLVCYVLFSIGHFLYMRFICRKFNDGIYPYSTRVLILMSVVFLATGFCVMSTYSIPIVRYSLIGVLLIILVLFRNKILSIAKDLIALRRHTD